MALKKVSGLIFHNLGWKIVSLIIAVALWFIVVNETNPTAINPTPYSIGLSIVNTNKLTESGYVLTNEAELKAVSVDISVRSSRNDLDALNKRRSEIRAYIDFSPIDMSKTTNFGERQSITVRIELPRTLSATRYEIINVNPMTVDVIIDKLVTESFNIYVDTIGEAAPDYTFLQALCDPASIEITGPQSDLETISYVRAEANVADLSESYEGILNLAVFDINGRDITSRLTLSQTEVNVSIPINKYAKVPISKPEVFGLPQEGSHVTKVELSPESAEIVGSEADIAAIKSITIGPISVEGKSETFTEVYDLRNNLLAMKSNCNVRNGTPHEVSVTITIEQNVEREIILRPENIIRLGAPQVYSLDYNDVILTISGLQSVLDEITDGHVSAIIDLTGLGPGTYDIESQIYLPASVTLISPEPLIRVVIPETEEVKAVGSPAAVVSPAAEVSPQSTLGPTVFATPEATVRP